MSSDFDLSSHILKISKKIFDSCDIVFLLISSNIFFSSLKFNLEQILFFLNTLLTIAKIFSISFVRLYLLKIEVLVFNASSRKDISAVINLFLFLSFNLNT